MPLILQVTQSPVSATVWAAWAWAASTSSISGGLNREANCTAAKMAAKSTHVASVEGPIWGRVYIFDSFVILFAVETRITAVVYEPRAKDKPLSRVAIKQSKYRLQGGFGTSPRPP